MADKVEDRVRTIIARVLQVAPENIRPEGLLSLSVISRVKMRTIAHRIEIDYDVTLAADAYELWTTVADVVSATERAIAADLARHGRAA
jgi:acyl carrier protein